MRSAVCIRIISREIRNYIVPVRKAKHFKRHFQPLKSTLNQAEIRGVVFYKQYGSIRHFFLFPEFLLFVRPREFNPEGASLSRFRRDSARATHSGCSSLHDRQSYTSTNIGLAFMQPFEDIPNALLVFGSNPNPFVSNT